MAGGTNGHRERAHEAPHALIPAKNVEAISAELRGREGVQLPVQRLGLLSSGYTVFTGSLVAVDVKANYLDSMDIIEHSNYRDVRPVRFTDLPDIMESLLQLPLSTGGAMSFYLENIGVALDGFYKFNEKGKTLEEMFIKILEEDYNSLPLHERACFSPGDGPVKVHINSTLHMGNPTGCLSLQAPLRSQTWW